MFERRFSTGYMDNAVFDLEGVVDTAVGILEPHAHEFDTLVGTGFSGGLIVPMLSTFLHKSFVMVRKDNDDSHHGQGCLLGHLGERWLFVDDFISSGETFRRVKNKVEYFAGGRNVSTDLVGAYLYATHLSDGERYRLMENNISLQMALQGWEEVQS